METMSIGGALERAMTKDATLMFRQTAFYGASCLQESRVSDAVLSQSFDLLSAVAV